MKMTKTLWVAAALASASILASAAPAAAEVDYTFLSTKTNFLVDTDTFVTSTTTFTSPELTCLKGACSSVKFVPTATYDEVILSSGATYKFSPMAFTDTTVTYKASGASFSTLEVSAAPEPETWALMIVGVGLVGGMMRYGRRADATVTAA